MEYRLKALLSLIPEEKRICNRCKQKVSENNFEVNHKDGKRYNSKLENLEIVCKKCHRGVVTDETMIMVTYRMPSNLLEKIDKKSKSLGINNSVLIRNILIKFFQDN